MRNYNLSSIKVIAALSVVLIHTSYLIYADGVANTLNYYWYRPLLNFAVPFFFAASGYLLSLKPLEYFKKYIKNIFKMFIVYTVLYYLFDVARAFLAEIMNGNSIGQSLLNSLTIREIGDFTSGTIGQSHLWYLWGLLIGVYILFLLLNKGVSIKFILYGSIVLYIITSVLRLNPSVENIIKEGGAFTGLAYITLGYYLGNRHKTSNNSLIKATLILTIYAVIYQYTYSNSLVDILLLGSTWYLIAFISNNIGQQNLLSKLDVYSTPVYLNHMFFITFYNVVSSVITMIIIDNLFLRVVLVTIFALVGSIIISKPISKIFKI